MKSFFTLLLLSMTTFLVAQNGQEMTLLSTLAPDNLNTDRPAPYNDVWGYTDCDGNEYAILGSTTNIHFIDLRDPANPVEIDRFAGGEATTWRDMKTYKDVAYATSDATSEGLMVFDLSNLPSNVTQVGQYTDVFASAHNIYIDEANGRLYVGGSDTQTFGMIIYDLTCDPHNPELLASFSTAPEGYVHDLYVRNNIAYISHGSSGYAIWDFNDVTNPTRMATVVTGGYNHSSWVTDDGQYAVFAEEIPLGEPLGIIDLSEMMNGDIEVVKEFSFPLLAPEFTDATPHNPYIRGNYVVSSYYEDGIHVYDISDPLNPVAVAYYDTYPDNTEYTGYNGNWGAYPYLPSGNILASDRQYGLFVLRAENVDFAEVTPFNQVDVQLAQGDTLLCNDEPVMLTSPATFDTYQWMFEGAPIEGATDAFYVATGSGSYALQVTNGNCEGMSCEVVVGRFGSADDMNITQDATGNLVFGVVGSEYQWFLNGEAIAGATTNTFSPTEAGVYTATAVSENGCSVMSNEFTFMPNGVQQFDNQTLINIYPTVVTDNVRIEIDSELNQTYEVQIFSTSGQLLQQQKVAKGTNTIVLNTATTGVYLVHIFNQNGRVVERIIKR